MEAVSHSELLRKAREPQNTEDDAAYREKVCENARQDADCIAGHDFRGYNDAKKAQT